LKTVLAVNQRSSLEHFLKVKKIELASEQPLGYSWPLGGSNPGTADYDSDRSVRKFNFFKHLQRLPIFISNLSQSGATEA
jgi:hypothetical protein